MQRKIGSGCSMIHRTDSELPRAHPSLEPVLAFVTDGLEHKAQPDQSLTRRGRTVAANRVQCLSDLRRVKLFSAVADDRLQWRVQIQERIHRIRLDDALDDDFG